MTDKPEDGGPAFPLPNTQQHGDAVLFYGKPGMSLRDWFAGMALQGLLANMNNALHDSWARDAYNMADAMLKARQS